jgi:dihydrofolate reductase
VRRLRYQVASSLDGYSAGPKGEFEWIPNDPDIDFAALYAQFDTLVMGRKTFMATRGSGDTSMTSGIQVVVFSRTLKAADYPDVVIPEADPVEFVRTLKEKPGKDIWLFGGGELFRTLLEARLVDTVEPAILPVMLGEGIPMLPPTSTRTTLSLARHRLYPKSGTMLLEYDVVR